MVASLRSAGYPLFSLGFMARRDGEPPIYKQFGSLADIPFLAQANLVEALRILPSPHAPYSYTSSPP